MFVPDHRKACAVHKSRFSRTDYNPGNTSESDSKAYISKRCRGKGRRYKRDTSSSSDSRSRSPPVRARTSTVFSIPPEKSEAAFVNTCSEVVALDYSFKKPVYEAISPPIGIPCALSLSLPVVPLSVPLPASPIVLSEYQVLFPPLVAVSDVICPPVVPLPLPLALNTIIVKMGKMESRLTTLENLVNIWIGPSTTLDSIPQVSGCLAVPDNPSTDFNDLPSELDSLLRQCNIILPKP